MSDEWENTLKCIQNAIQPIYPDFRKEFIFWPLFNELKPSFSLEKIREIRPEEYNESSYSKHILFLARNSKEIHDVSKIPSGYFYMNQVLCDPKFQINDEFDISKAVLSAELLYQDATDNAHLLNVVNIAQETFFNDLLNAINNLKDMKSTTPPKIKHFFYDTFIYFYSGIRKNALGKDNKCIERIQDFYNEINGITENTHLADSNLFRAPVPFQLQDLVDARREIEKTLGWKNGDEGKTIKLFLIDNKIDKFHQEDKQTICDVFEDFGIAHLFDIEMVGIGYGQESNPDYGKFDFRKFKNEKTLEEIRKEEEKEYKYYQKAIKKYKFKEVETYTDIIYNRLKSSHFILLDFFLNEENTYLAFDFIKDICKIKKQEGDYSTTWYFITSAVYDSVVKYSQSGLLSEYYESAVVNAGDDPTNEKRQIIFVYKLLTFIQSRLRSFNSNKTAIYNHMLNDEKGQGNGLCCVTATNKSIKTEGCLLNCEKDDCLEKMQTHIKRYLTEYDNIWSLFYDEKHKGDYKDIAVLLDDTIKKFLWLPEADWQRIQHQIDYINAKFKSLGENRMFSCKYINGEIEKRSEIY